MFRPRDLLRGGAAPLRRARSHPCHAPGYDRGTQYRSALRTSEAIAGGEASEKPSGSAERRRPGESQRRYRRARVLLRRGLHQQYLARWRTATAPGAARRSCPVGVAGVSPDRRPIRIARLASAPLLAVGGPPSPVVVLWVRAPGGSSAERWRAPPPWSCRWPAPRGPHAQPLGHELHFLVELARGSAPCSPRSTEPPAARPSGRPRGAQPARRPARTAASVLRTTQSAVRLSPGVASTRRVPARGLKVEHGRPSSTAIRQARVANHRGGRAVFTRPSPAPHGPAAPPVLLGL